MGGGLVSDWQGGRGDSHTRARDTCDTHATYDKTAPGKRADLGAVNANEVGALLHDLAGVLQLHSIVLSVWSGVVGTRMQIQCT